MFGVQSSEACHELVEHITPHKTAYCHFYTFCKCIPLYLYPDISFIFQFLLGDPEVLPSQMKYIISPACSGSIPGFPTSWTSPENLERRAPRRHSDEMPESKKRTSGSTSSSLWGLELVNWKFCLPSSAPSSLFKGQPWQNPNTYWKHLWLPVQKTHRSVTFFIHGMLDVSDSCWSCIFSFLENLGPQLLWPWLEKKKRGSTTSKNWWML